MLKKTLAMLLAIMMLMGAAAAMADGLNMDYYVNTSKYYSITPTEDGLDAFVDCDDYLTIGERSFTHPYESDNLYSYVVTDIIAIDYQSADAYTVMRTWIKYNGKKFINADSVTFTIDGTDYTFTGLADADDRVEENGEFTETLMIKHSTENMKFMSAVCGKASEVLDVMGTDAELPTIPFVLHGAEEDIACEMSGYSILDLMLMAISLNADNANAFQFLSEVTGSNLIIK